MTAQHAHTHDLTIRRLEGLDDAALRRLGELEGREAPAGPLLGAFLDDRLLAVVSLTARQSLADPFVASAEAVELLRLRADQIHGPRGRSRRLCRSWGPSGRRAVRSRGSLAGSPGSVDPG